VQHGRDIAQSELLEHFGAQLFDPLPSSTHVAVAGQQMLPQGLSPDLQDATSTSPPSPGVGTSLTQSTSAIDSVAATSVGRKLTATYQIRHVSHAPRKGFVTWREGRQNYSEKVD
jgi:hypothetical protein